MHECKGTREQPPTLPFFLTARGSVKVAIREGPPSESGPKAPKASDPSVRPQAKNMVALMCLARTLPHRNERVGDLSA